MTRPQALAIRFARLHGEVEALCTVVDTHPMCPTFMRRMTEAIREEYSQLAGELSEHLIACDTDTDQLDEAFEEASAAALDEAFARVSQENANNQS